MKKLVIIMFCMVFLIGISLVSFAIWGNKEAQINIFDRPASQEEAQTLLAEQKIYDTPIGYEIYNNTVEIWNTQATYYFNQTSGTQFTNHYQDFWTRNIFCLGYYSGGEWNKIKCADELGEFEKDIYSDLETYVNATLWKDFTYNDYDFRLGIRYHLKLDDEKLSVIIYGKNRDNETIPYELGFAWKVTDMEIPKRVGEDGIKINNTEYDLSESLNLLFKDMTEEYYAEENNQTVIKTREIPFFKLHDYPEFLTLDWNENLNYAVKLYSDGNQENAYVALLINAGTFTAGQEKSTTLYWIDAEGDFTGDEWSNTGGGNTGVCINDTVIGIIDITKKEITFWNYFGDSLFNKSLGAGNDVPRGCYMNSTNILISDDDKSMYVYAAIDVSLKFSKALNATCGAPRAVEVYDEIIYVADSAGLICKYNQADYTNIDQWNPSHNAGWVGIAIDINYIRLAQYTPSNVSLYYINETYTGISYDPSGDALNPRSIITNITDVWLISDAAPNKIYRYEGSPEPPDITPPYFTDGTPTNQTISYNIPLKYDINASDDRAINCFTVNDTTNFKIDCDGWLENNTLLSVQLYNLNITVNDSSNNLNSTIIWVNVTDHPPNILIVSPINGTNTSNNQIEINYTVSDDISLDSCWYSNDSMTLNTSIDCGTNITTVVWSEGDHTVIVWANDSLNSQNSSTIFFTVDTTVPVISVTAPTTVDYLETNHNLSLNWTVSDPLLNSCWYEYAGTNYTVVCDANTTQLNITGYGDRTFIFYADDSVGNKGSLLWSWKYHIFENLQTYNATGYETKTENFIINISYPSSDWSSISANLFYNRTSYLGTKIGSGDTLTFSKGLTMPLINTPTNFSFTWEFLLTNSSGTTRVNTTSHIQTISPILFTRCNATYSFPIFVNYSIYDESKLTPTSASMDATFTYWLGGGTLIKNYSLDSVDSNSSFTFCTNVNETFNTDVVINLQSAGYHERTYYFNDEQYTKTTTLKSLYLLNNTAGTNIIIQVRDANLIPADGYFVIIERYYPGTGKRKEVVVEKTDEYGQIVARLIENTVKYRFTFRNASNSIVKTTSDMTIACRATICVLPFVLEDVTDDFERFENVTDYDWTFSFENSTKSFTFAWNDVSGVSATNWLRVERYLWNGTELICNTTSTASSGSLTCSVGTLEASYQAQVFRKVGSGIWRRIAVLSEKVGITFKTFGTEGLVWSFFLLMTMIAIGYWYPPIGIGLYLFGAVLLSFTRIIYVNPAILIAEFVIGVAFIWAFSRGRKK